MLIVVFQMTVRDGRVKRTETVSNSTHPEWNEELQFIVDDPDAQSVSVIIKDDDAFNDTVSSLGPGPFAMTATSLTMCCLADHSVLRCLLAGLCPMTHASQLACETGQLFPH